LSRSIVVGVFIPQEVVEEEEEEEEGVYPVNMRIVHN
jgi:hypothetical protein